MQKIQDYLISLFPYDKMLHFFVGFFIYCFFNLFLVDYIALFVVVLIAISKEIRDQIVYRGADIKDILFTVLPSFILVIKNHI